MIKKSGKLTVNTIRQSSVLQVRKRKAFQKLHVHKAEKIVENNNGHKWCRILERRLKVVMR